jgi:hypothetical protein
MLRNGPTMPAHPVAHDKIDLWEKWRLSRRHPRGRHKARVFVSVLGMTSADAEELRRALIFAAAREDAQLGASDQYGVRYIIDFSMRRDERSATIRSCWMVRRGETAPRFVTCYVL